METKKKGIVIFLIFLLVVGVIYIKSLPPSTNEIDGKYQFYTKSTFDNNYQNTGEYQFKSGKISSNFNDGITVEGNFKILDNDFVEIQFENNVTTPLKFKIDKKDNVIRMTYGDYLLERVNE